MVINSFEILEKSNKLQCWIQALRIGKKVTSSMRVCSLHFKLLLFYFYWTWMTHFLLMRLVCIAPTIYCDLYSKSMASLLEKNDWKRENKSPNRSQSCFLIVSTRLRTIGPSLLRDWPFAVFNNGYQETLERTSKSTRTTNYIVWLRLTSKTTL